MVKERQFEKWLKGNYEQKILELTEVDSAKPPLLPTFVF